MHHRHWRKITTYKVSLTCSTPFGTPKRQGCVCKVVVYNVFLFSFTEWSQSQFSIRGQSRTFTPCSKKWQYTMCILSVAIQRKSQHDIKGMLLLSHSFFKKEIAKRPTLKKKYHDFWRKHISRKTKCNWRLLFFLPHAKQPRKIIVFCQACQVFE